MLVEAGVAGRFNLRDRRQGAILQVILKITRARSAIACVGAIPPERQGFV